MSSAAPPMPGLPRLVVDGRCVAPLEIADGFFSRLKGLLGKSSFDGAMLIRSSKPVRSVHTLGMRFPIDVAYCDADLRVVDVLAGAPPYRFPKARRSAAVTQVLEAEAGAFARWGLTAPENDEPGSAGSQLAIEPAGARPFVGDDGFGM